MIDMTNRDPKVPQHVADGEEFIICAAIWFDDGVERVHLPRNIKTGLVSSGWRHGNCITVLAAMFPLHEYKQPDSKTVQGFLTSQGFFVDRKEAGDIAFNAGQIPKENDYLFSEDLY